MKRFFGGKYAVLIALGGMLVGLLLAGWITAPRLPTAGVTDIQLAELVAQQQSSHWAFIITMVTSLGLIALFWTLVETQEVGFHSKRIGEAQTKAYLGCIDADLRSDGLVIFLTITIKNFGASPALQVKPFHALLRLHKYAPASEQPPAITAVHNPVMISAGQEQVLAFHWQPFEHPHEPWAGENTLETPMTAEILLLWQNVFGQNDQLVLFFERDERAMDIDDYDAWHAKVKWSQDHEARGGAQRLSQEQIDELRS